MSTEATNTESTNPTIEDTVNSLTGYDELAITKRFGVSFDQLPGTMLVRALAFTIERRNGLNDADAYKAAMNDGAAASMARFADATPDTEQSAEGND